MYYSLCEEFYWFYFVLPFPFSAKTSCFSLVSVIWKLCCILNVIIIKFWAHNFSCWELISNFYREIKWVLLPPVIGRSLLLGTTSHLLNESQLYPNLIKLISQQMSTYCLLKTHNRSPQQAHNLFGKTSKYRESRAKPTMKPWMRLCGAELKCCGRRGEWGLGMVTITFLHKKLLQYKKRNYFNIKTSSHTH